MAQRRDPGVLLRAAARGKEASALAPVIEEAQHAEGTKVISRVFAVIGSGEALDPTQAVAAWHELYALHRLARALDKLPLKGQRASATLTEFMDKEERPHDG